MQIDKKAKAGQAVTVIYLQLTGLVVEHTSIFPEVWLQ